MIQGLEAATPEPARRRHVLVLSAAVAAVSLAVFVALVVPPSREASGSSPAPSPTARVTLTIVSNPTAQMRLDLTRDSLCPDGTRLLPPYHLAFDADGGAIFALRSVAGGTTRSVPVTLDPKTRAPWVTVKCDTSDVVDQGIAR